MGMYVWTNVETWNCNTTRSEHTLTIASHGLPRTTQYKVVSRFSLELLRCTSTHNRSRMHHTYKLVVADSRKLYCEAVERLRRVEELLLSYFTSDDGVEEAAKWAHCGRAMLLHQQQPRDMEIP